MVSGNEVDRDVGFWVGLQPDGAWQSFRSFIPLSVITKSLKDDFIAMEVVMKNGKKHAILRGLATVSNDSDVKLDISICLASMIHSRDITSDTSRNIVVEEIFQNQSYHPMSGWGKTFPGGDSNNLGQWSTRDFSLSSNVSVS